jgi:hypothetical protein
MNSFLSKSVALAAALFTAAAGAQVARGSKLAASTAPEPSTAQASVQPGPNAEKEDAAKLAAGGWLILLDRGDWGRSWETASAVFRTAVPLPAWMDGIAKAREPFGRMLDRKPVEAVYKTALQGRPAGDYVTVIFETQFENKKVEEVVTTVLEPDGKWRATGYSTR